MSDDSEDEAAFSGGGDASDIEVMDARPSARPKAARTARAAVVKKKPAYVMDLSDEDEVDNESSFALGGDDSD